MLLPGAWVIGTIFITIVLSVFVVGVATAGASAAHFVANMYIKQTEIYGRLIRGENVKLSKRYQTKYYSIAGAVVAGTLTIYTMAGPYITFIVYMKG